MVVRNIRYCLTRMLFLVMGLRIEKWRKQVETFWKLGTEERRSILENILQSNSPLNAIGEPVTSLKELQVSPILTKNTYRTLARASSVRSRYSRKTSGTTGEPTKVELSKEELSLMLGVRDYCFRHYGVKLGDREARFWGREAQGLKSKLKNLALNRKVCFPMGEGAIHSVAQTLSWEPDYLYGYASLLLEAAALVEKHSISFTPPKCVICTAETVMPVQKDYLNKIFKAPVAEEYGATEFDVIAFECKDGHRHLVNPWLVVKNTDQDILVSDLFRKSANLVNYELGDSVDLEVVNCDLVGDAQYIKFLEGRSINRFVYSDCGNRFHAVDLAYAINEYQRIENKIFNFRIVQFEYGAIDVYVSVELESRTESLKKHIEGYILKKTGQSLVVNIFYEVVPKYFTEKSYFIQRIKMPLNPVTQT